MRFRYLRIAFSAVCGILCLALIVWWVRSYWHLDQFGRIISDTSCIGGQTLQGQFMFVYTNDPALVATLKAEGLTGWKGDILVDDWIRATPWAQNQPIGALLFKGFKFSKGAFSLPHWFLVLLSATCAAVAWPKWSRRFTLHSLLIIMAVVGILMLAITYAIK
jgi:hypothetical protein